MKQKALEMFVGLMLAVCSLAGCTQTTESSKAMTGAFEKSKRMLALQQKFADEHPREGINAHAFVQRLKDEAFVCRVQLGRRFHAGTEGDLGKFTVTLEPTVRCAREPSGYTECAQFRVALEIDWKDPETRPLAKLADQLNVSSIRRASAICESRPPSPEDRAGIARGLAIGDIATIN